MLDIQKLSAWSSEDQEWLVDLLGLVGLLKKCIIDKQYRISDSWVNAISLNQVGNEHVERLRAKRHKPNESKMVVFLRIWSGDSLFVSRETDPDALRKLLSEEILNGKIRYPYVFGRLASDLIFEKFPGMNSLTAAQTKILLDELPLGVFQEGRTVVGPMGAFRSRSFRAIPPPFHEVYGYLCSEAHCLVLHPVDISTGESSVSKAQNRLDEILDRSTQGDIESMRNLNRIVQKIMGLTSERFSTDLINVISDDLTIEEMRCVVERLFSEICRDPVERTRIGKQMNVIFSNPSDLIESFSVQQLEQAILYFTDEEICRAIDRNVRAGNISVSAYGKRKSVVSRFPEGSYDLSAEIGSYGVRFVDGTVSGFSSNLSKLIRDIYFGSGSVLSAEDLAFALDLSPGKDLKSELASYLVKETPDEIIDRLILSNRQASDFAGEDYGVSDYLSEGRSVFGAALKWKLGAPIVPGNLIIESLKSQCNALIELVKSGADESELRGTSSNVFVAFEEILQRSLSYCAWAFTVDHYLEIPRFSYDLDIGSNSLSWVEQMSPTADPRLRLTPGGKNMLSQLSAGFARLAKGLVSVESRSGEYVRPKKDFPLPCIYGTSVFSFPSRCAFLNLREISREMILKDLKSMSRRCQAGSLGDTRNDVMHGNTDFPSSERLIDAANEIGIIIKELEDTGLFPLVYDLKARSIDRFGRETIEYERQGKIITLNYPSVELAPGLPYRSTRLLMFPKYEVGESGPLRFKLITGSPRSGYWKDWPPRWPERADIPLGNSTRLNYPNSSEQKDEAI
ncbi:hypothetical protein ACIQYZ_36110 [Rhodococcus erythropolis]